MKQPSGIPLPSSRAAWRGRPVFLILLPLVSFTLLMPPRTPSTGSEEDKAQPVIIAPSPVTDFSDYIWPTDAGSVITSTFAEYRRAHFHGGIDISTGNDTGFLVFASRDGYVSRIIVSPDGYGKMLFVRHQDGFSTTYAHLRNFAPELDERIRLEQERLGVYPVAITCGPKEFPVRKGDVIAFTGETGVGSPHLHFEIRDPDNDFVNPLQCPEFPNVDSIVPTIRRLAVRPIGPVSTVDGSEKTQTYRVRENGRGSYTVSDPIRINGAAGFEIDVRDQSEETYYRQGIHRLTLFVDEEPFYEVALDNAPSGNSHQSGLYFDWELADAGLGRFQRLFVESFPNDLHFYRPAADSAGILRLSGVPAGIHDFRIVAMDRAGNTSSVSGSVVLEQWPSVEVTTYKDSITVALDPAVHVRDVHISARDRKTSRWTNSVRPLAEFGNPLVISTRGADLIRIFTGNQWGGKSNPILCAVPPLHAQATSLKISHENLGSSIQVHVRSEGILPIVPALNVYEGSRQRTIPLGRVSDTHFMGGFVPDATVGGLRRLSVVAPTGKGEISAFEEFDLYPLVAGGSGTYFADGGRLLISYDSASVLATLFMEVENGSHGDERTYLLGPSQAVLNDGIVVGVRVDRMDRNAGLMIHSRTGWNLIGLPKDFHNGMVTGRISQMLGETGVLSDSTAPILTGFRIRQGRQAFPEISFRFDDGFSGIEYEALKMYIDETPVIPEVDGEHNRAAYRCNRPLAKGPHVVTIRARDRFGNSRELRKEFSVR